MSKRLGGIIGCKYKTTSWHLNGFPDGCNMYNTVLLCFMESISTRGLIALHPRSLQVRNGTTYVLKIDTDRATDRIT